MTKTELVQALAKKLGVSQKQAKAYVEAFVDVVTGALKSREVVSITGFGKFVARERAARTQKLPNSSKVVKVPAHYVPAFRAGKKLREAVK